MSVEVAWLIWWLYCGVLNAGILTAYGLREFPLVFNGRWAARAFVLAMPIPCGAVGLFVTLLQCGTRHGWLIWPTEKLRHEAIRAKYGKTSPEWAQFLIDGDVEALYARETARREQSL